MMEHVPRWAVMVVAYKALTVAFPSWDAFKAAINVTLSGTEDESFFEELVNR